MSLTSSSDLYFAEIVVNYNSTDYTCRYIVSYLSFLLPDDQTEMENLVNAKAIEEVGGGTVTNTKLTPMLNFTKS